MTDQASRRKSTENWYFTKGWAEINRWVSECKAKNVEHIYIENFEIFNGVPLDKPTLVRLFDEDAPRWNMKIEEDGVLVIEAKHKKK